MGGNKNAYRFPLGKPEGKRCLENLVMDGRIITNSREQNPS
jgi:hypothetical protein